MARIESCDKHAPEGAQPEGAQPLVPDATADATAVEASDASEDPLYTRGYYSIPLATVIALIPATVLEPLAALRVHTLGDVITLDLRYCADRRLMNRMCIERVRSLASRILNNPAVFKRAYITAGGCFARGAQTWRVPVRETVRSLGIGIPPRAPYIDAFRQVIDEYVELLAQGNDGCARIADLLLARYGIGCEPMLLSQLGNRHSLTRERVRQLLNVALGQLRDALSGTCIRVPHMRIGSDVLGRHAQFRLRTGDDSVLDPVRLCSIATAGARDRIRDEDAGIFRLLVAVLGYDEKLAAGRAWLVRKGLIRNDVFSDWFDTVLRILRTTVAPVDEEDLIDIVLRLYGGNRFARHEIRKILVELPGVDVFKELGVTYYECRFEHLPTTVYRVCRILRDHGAPMRCEDIRVQFLHRLPPPAGTHVLAAFDRFSWKSDCIRCDPSTGMFSLHDWVLLDATALRETD